MAAVTEIVVPSLGIGMEEAYIIEWVIEVGDMVQEGEAVVLIETDKVETEIPSPVSGRLIERRFEADSTVPVGGVLGVIETHDQA